MVSVQSAAPPLSYPSILGPPPISAQLSSVSAQQISGPQPFFLNDSSVPKPSYAEKLAGNRNSSIGLPLLYSDDPSDSVTVSWDELDEVVPSWGFCLVGFFHGRFPGIDALLNICKSWNVPYKFTTLSSGWLIFKFESKAACDQVLAQGPYFAYGRPLLLKHLPQCFEYDEDGIKTMPIWVNLPGLPLDCWNAKILGKIASKIGKPLQTDGVTASKERMSFARILVDVDITKALVRSVSINLPTGHVRNQKVFYEHEPITCTTCKLVGHNAGACCENIKGGLFPRPLPEKQKKKKEEKLKRQASKEDFSGATPEPILSSFVDNMQNNTSPPEEDDTNHDFNQDTLISDMVENLDPNEQLNTLVDDGTAPVEEPTPEVVSTPDVIITPDIIITPMVDKGKAKVVDTPTSSSPFSGIGTRARKQYKRKKGRRLQGHSSK